MTPEELKKFCASACTNPAENGHSSACYKAQAEWGREALARIDRMRRDIRNATRRAERQLKKVR